MSGKEITDQIFVGYKQSRFDELMLSPTSQVNIVMTIKEANLKIGDKYITKFGSGPWIVKEIVSRGVISTHAGFLEVSGATGELYWAVVTGSHKHLDEWDVEIRGP